MSAVRDTGPINYLVWIGLVDLLPRLFSKVTIPHEVHEELLAADAPRAVKLWAANLPDFVQVLELNPGLSDDERFGAIHRGERAGREAARRCGVRITVTPGVLDEAARQGMISFEEAFQRLRATSFRYPKEVVARLLKEHGASCDGIN